MFKMFTFCCGPKKEKETQCRMDVPKKRIYYIYLFIFIYNIYIFK